MNKKYTYFKKLCSYVWPMPVAQVTGIHGSKLEVVYQAGRLMLNSPKANYSYGGLHKVFQIAFRHYNIHKHKPAEILILGFGVGSVASIIQHEQQYLGAEITGVEIDPQVIRLGREFFNTDRFKQTRIIEADAFSFVQASDQCYDLIVVDIYQDTDVPAVYQEESFIRMLRERLRPNGHLMYNKVAHTKKYYEEFLLIHSLINKYFKEVRIIKALGMNRVFIAHP